MHLKGQRTDQIQLIIKLINDTEEKLVLIKVNTEEKLKACFNEGKHRGKGHKKLQIYNKSMEQ